MSGGWVQDKKRPRPTRPGPVWLARRKTWTLALASGQGLAVGRVDLDLLGPDGLDFGQPEVEDAVLELGLCLVGVDARR